MEAYEADKAWASKGPASVTCPAPLRAGRIICELNDTEVVDILLCSTVSR